MDQPLPNAAAHPALPRTVWVLGVVSLLMDLSSEIYHALLPAFLTITLGLPVAAMGALDGFAEATASMAKLVSGRLSDRNQRRKPWILLGYGMAALSKPLFPIATTALPVLGARFVDRFGKGIRGAPRDAMIADETPPELRGRAFGLRQSMDTVGAFLAPLAAIGLMILFRNDIRAVFWVAVIPAFLSFGFAWVMLRESGDHAPIKAKIKWGGFRDLDPAVKRLIGVGFLFGLARFSESFLILRGIDAGISASWSPIVLALFNLAYLLLAYPAGILSDRMSPKGPAACRDRIARRRRPRAGEGRFAVDCRARRHPVGRAHGLHPRNLQPDDRRRRPRGAARDELRRVLLRLRDRRPAVEPRRRTDLGPERRECDLHRRSGAGGSGRRNAGIAAPVRPLGDLTARRTKRRHPVRYCGSVEELLLE